MLHLMHSVGGKQTKGKRAHDASSSESDDNAESTSFSCAVLERITRNGPSMRGIHQRFAEIEKQSEVIIDPDGHLCILCYKNKKKYDFVPMPTPAHM